MLWNALLFPFYSFLFFFFLKQRKTKTVLPLTWLAALTNDPRPPSLSRWDHGTCYLQSLPGAPRWSGCIPLPFTGEAPASASAHLLLDIPQSQHSTPPDLSATFYSTFLFLRFCPPPYFGDDKMGLEGPLTGQLVPFCCSTLSGSTIIWEVLIQRAHKILQQRGCRELPQAAALAGGDREGAEKIWGRKN